MADNPQTSLLGKIAAYTEIMSTDPRSTIFVSLSEAYRKLGMFDDASTIAVKGLDYLPDYSPGHVVLARIRCQQGDMPGAEASFRQALEYDPQSLSALVGFSRLFLLQQRKAEARQLLLQARELTPADPVVNKLLLGLPEPAPQVRVEPTPVAPPAPVEQLVAAAPEVYEAPEPLESATLADLYLKQGMADKARSIFQRLLARDPDNLELRRRIRDLDSPSVEPSLAPTPSPVLVEQEAETPVLETPVLETAETLATELEPAVEHSVLTGLNRLLASIQKRRGDVQGSS